LKKYDVVVIGLGRIGLKTGFDRKRVQPASHIAAILENKRLQLSAVCDLDQNSRGFFKKKVKLDIPIVKDYNALLEKIKNGSIKCDILVITTTENTHKEILDAVIKKLSKLKKSIIVFCEKPITTELRSTLEIKNKFKKSNLKLVINHSRRWSKIWNKALMFSKKLGGINDSAFYFSTSPENKSMDQLRDGIHIADIINWFNLQEKIFVKRKNVNYFIYDFYLWGEKGKIELLNNGSILNYFVSKKSKKFDGFNELQLKKSFKIKESMLQNAYEEFVKFLDGKIPHLSTNIEDAIAAIKIFEKYVYSKNILKRGKKYD